jgi:hypothetical protein
LRHPKHSKTTLRLHCRRTKPPEARKTSLCSAVCSTSKGSYEQTPLFRSTVPWYSRKQSNDMGTKRREIMVRVLFSLLCIFFFFLVVDDGGTLLAVRVGRTGRRHGTLQWIHDLCSTTSMVEKCSRFLILFRTPLEAVMKLE